MLLVDSKGRGRLVPTLAGLAVAVLLLTGCQGDPEPAASEVPAGPPSSASPSAAPSATPKPSPASSLGPAVNIPVPEKPALADENTAEGLEAFTEYWFELFSYGYETNDWAPFDAITGPDCRTCNETKSVVQEIYNDGRWLAGGQFEVVIFSTDFRLNTSGSAQAFVDNRQSEITYFESDGTTFPPEPASEAAVDVIFATYEDQSWQMLDYGLPEGT